MMKWNYTNEEAAETPHETRRVGAVTIILSLVFDRRIFKIDKDHLVSAIGSMAIGNEMLSSTRRLLEM